MPQTPEQEDKMTRIIEMMKGMDFSVRQSEYEAQIMKAVKDYAAQDKEAALKSLAEEIKKYKTMIGTYTMDGRAGPEPIVHLSVVDTALERVMKEGE